MIDGCRVSLFRRNLGRAGEEIARRYLRRKGFRILERNFTCPTGEIDLICADEDCLVFVEVKTRSQDTDADPEESITCAKRKHLERAARSWLALHRPRGCACRFDAVCVVTPPNGKPRIRHIVEAFAPTGLA